MIHHFMKHQNHYLGHPVQQVCQTHFFPVDCNLKSHIDVKGVPVQICSVLIISSYSAIRILNPQGHGFDIPAIQGPAR